VLCRGADREIASSLGRVTGDGLVKAARIVSWVNIALSVIGVALFLLFVVAIGSSGGFTGTY
jgi:hypothetical protein